MGVKLQALETQYSEFIPETLQDGVLYISLKYKIAMHRCACGCGCPTVTPLDEFGWRLTGEGSAVTLQPSIGNFSFPCRSHYWIRDGKVIWC